ncbi:hypothetical protein [Komagataeibacter xylinus]|uniref:hypothetical protein n=1 Tax=Komagataeibacter xylinus TaxID=28448 RepID=UPI001330AA51|nr:hypothetical protein [Komagataeibacter xylinus]
MATRFGVRVQQRGEEAGVNFYLDNNNDYHYQEYNPWALRQIPNRRFPNPSHGNLRHHLHPGDAVFLWKTGTGARRMAAQACIL